MNFDKKILKNFDWIIFITVLAIVLFSLVVIGSAVHVTTEEGSSFYVTKQLKSFIFSLAIMIVVILIDYRTIGNLSKYIYIVTVILLFLVHTPLGTSRMGAQRWLNLGFGVIQPSEFAKLAIIVTFAKMLENRTGKLNTFKDLILPVLHVGLPFLLIVTQPDLGTSLVFLFIAFMMMFAAGLNFKLILKMAVIGICSVPILWQFLRDYQKNRLLTFMNPESDITGDGYHVYQSKISIGSGGFKGKGLYKGTQNMYKFLPERHTDFIFSVVGEEFGFIGAVFLLTLYGILLLRCVYLAKNAKDDFGSYIIIGVSSMFLFHILVNVGMTMGIMPVTGLPLPFMSYGGSSMLTNMIGIGLILNVGLRRKKLRF